MQRRLLTAFGLAAALAAAASLLYPVLADRVSSARASSQPVPRLLPTPPQQNAPWTPPAGGNAAGFPATLLTATETLFEQGLADPRGGEYSTITVQVGNVWNGGGGTVETRGWVLPGESDGKRFAVCWNGLVYPVVDVKGPADLRADIAATIDKGTDRLDRERRSRGNFHSGFTFYWSNATPEATSVSLEHPSLLKAVYLLRLGEYDLARRFYRLWEDGTPPNLNGNSENRRDPYLLLATLWMWAAYDRAVCAHMRGADRLALDDTLFLTSVQSSIEAEAAKHGYRTLPGGGALLQGVPCRFWRT